MRIAIVGAGAMGSLYGGVLAENGHDVSFVDVDQEHVEAVRNRGLIIHRDEKQRTVKGIQAFTDAAALAPAELMIVFVKSTYTEEVILSNRNLIGPDTIVLTLQNGLGNIEKIEKHVARTQIIAGTSANGANRIGPGEIRHAGWAGTTIGELDGQDTERIQALEEILGTGELGPVSVSHNVIGLIWDKLLANVGINALTALTRRRNGELLEDPALTDLMNRLVEEAENVARARKIRLSYSDGPAYCRSIARATSENISSMLADILHGRKTEITSLNGAIVEEGEKAGVPTPVNRDITTLILALESAKQ